MSDDPIRPLIDALDPLLVRAGFAEAQGGGDIALYCAAFVDIAENFPHLPQAHSEQAESMECACVDLTFTLTPAGLLKTIGFEAVDLEDTLVAIGASDDAWLVFNAYDRPVSEVAPTLHDVLKRLFHSREDDQSAVAPAVDDALTQALEARHQRLQEDFSSTATFQIGLP